FTLLRECRERVFVVLGRVHIPEEASRAIKSLPVSGVKDFRIEMLKGFGDFSRAAFKELAERRRRRHTPGRTERLESMLGARDDDLCVGRRSPYGKVSNPAGIEEGHIATYNQTMRCDRIALRCVFDACDDATQRAFARPLVGHDRSVLAFIVWRGRYHAHIPDCAAEEIAHAREHGLAVELRERLVSAKPRACATREDVTYGDRSRDAAGRA